MAEFKLNPIAGRENLVRALQIAVFADVSIKFVSEYAKRDIIPLMEFLNEIVKFNNEDPYIYFEIFPVSSDTMMGQYVIQLNDIKFSKATPQEINDVEFNWNPTQSTTLLLKKAIDVGNMNNWDVEKTVYLAKAIALLDGSKNVKIDHMAEAIIYQPLSFSDTNVLL